MLSANLGDDGICLSVQWSSDAVRLYQESTPRHLPSIADPTLLADSYALDGIILPSACWWGDEGHSPVSATAARRPAFSLGLGERRRLIFKCMTCVTLGRWIYVVGELNTGYERSYWNGRESREQGGEYSEISGAAV